MKFNILRGASRRVALEGRRTVLPPVPNPKRSKWIKSSHGRYVIGLKDHRSHQPAYGRRYQ